ERSFMAEKTEMKYVITNHRSGKVLASCGGSAVQMTANDGETQVWCAVPAEGTSVQLVHKVSGLALTVPGEAENGTALVLAEAQGNASQLWKLTTTVKGCRRITHVASGKVVDIKDISDSDGAPAQLWEFVKGDNQNWVLTEVEKEKKAPAKCAAKTAKPAAKEKAKAEVKAEAKPEVKAEAKPVAKTTKAAAKITKTAKKAK
ncbi:RICIN domain-containing protein, partial [Hominenteromicrobium sp.]|uniref:RICIN domain-containing protein n=1 Tax=Hominenteromicrobium sp. TaxID=3073581 RepID=UPI003AB39F0E